MFFFSLDAASSLVVWAARNFWGLPYHRARIETTLNGSVHRYACKRSATDVVFQAEARVGEALPMPEPESLEFFLCERYQFCAERRGRLRRARVHHSPYRLHAVREASITPSLLTACGLPSHGPMTQHLYSPGVDVEVFATESV